LFCGINSKNNRYFLRQGENIMTYEQAQIELSRLPTDKQLGVKLAQRAIAEGIIDKVSNDRNLDKIFGKEFEQGFNEYYNAWKIMQKYN
jgi:hypothetical protein